MMINELHSLKRCFSHAVTLLSRRCHDGTLDSAGSLLSPKTYVSTFKLWCCFKQDLSIHCRGLWETHEFCARGNINSVKWYVPVLKCASVWCWRNYNHTVYDRMKWIIIHLQWLLLNTSGVEAPLFSVASVFDELILIFSIPTAFFTFFPLTCLLIYFECSAQPQYICRDTQIYTLNTLILVGIILQFSVEVKCAHKRQKWYYLHI